MISVSTRMPYQAVRKNSVKMKVEKSDHPVLMSRKIYMHKECVFTKKVIEKLPQKGAIKKQKNWFRRLFTVMEIIGKVAKMHNSTC